MSKRKTSSLESYEFFKIMLTLARRQLAIASLTLQVDHDQIDIYSADVTSVGQNLPLAPLLYFQRLRVTVSRYQVFHYLLKHGQTLVFVRLSCSLCRCSSFYKIFPLKLKMFCYFQFSPFSVTPTSTSQNKLFLQSIFLSKTKEEVGRFLPVRNMRQKCVISHQECRQGRRQGGARRAWSPPIDMFGPSN